MRLHEVAALMNSFGENYGGIFLSFFIFFLPSFALFCFDLLSSTLQLMI